MINFGQFGDGFVGLKQVLGELRGSSAVSGCRIINGTALRSRVAAFDPVRACSAAFAACDWLRCSECSVLFGYVRFWAGWRQQVRGLLDGVCTLAFTAAVRWHGPGCGWTIVVGNVHNIALAFYQRRSGVLNCTQARAGDVNFFAHWRTAQSRFWCPLPEGEG